MVEKSVYVCSYTDNSNLSETEHKTLEDAFDSAKSKSGGVYIVDMDKGANRPDRHFDFPVVTSAHLPAVEFRKRIEAALGKDTVVP